MRIFIIAGKGHHGKNTIAKYIKEYYNDRDEKTIITGFSKYIKLFAKEISPWDGNDETKPRELLQKIGSKIRNDIKEDFFTHRMLEDITFYKDFFDNIIISDARLPFEIENMREKYPNALAIRVNRVDYETTMKENEKNHETETSLDKYDRFDFEIENNDLLDLKSQVFEILEGID